MERLAALKAQVKTLLEKLDRRQKIAAAVATTLTLGGLLLIIATASSTPYRVLFSDLPSEELARVVEVLEEQGIPYELESDTTISVPSDLLHDARLRLAGQGLPEFEGVGFELFDDSDFGMTSFTQRVNYQRAMEAELARTIRHLRGVRSARVHLVLPEEALFREDQEQPSASVVLTTDGSMLPDAAAIQSVRHLVASAVEGLSPTQVTIVDQAGRMLARASDDSTGVDAGEAMAMGTELENDMTQRIVRLLEPMVGEGNVRASVRVELDTSEVIETTESFDPTAVAVRSEEQSEESEMHADNELNGGVPGAASNLPGGPGATNEGITSTTTRTNEAVNYEINSTVRHRTQSGYQIVRLTAAVIVDEEALASALDGGEDQDAPVTLNTEVEMVRLTELVKNAVGFNEGRGDRVMVSLASFVPMGLAEPVDDSILRDPGFIVPALRYVVLLAATVLLGLFVVRPTVRALARAKDAGDDDMQLIVRTVGELDGQGQTVTKVGERTNEAMPPHLREQERLRNEIIELSRSDLDRASQVISQWIRMDGA